MRRASCRLGKRRSWESGVRDQKSEVSCRGASACPLACGDQAELGNGPSTLLVAAMTGFERDGQFVLLVVPCASAVMFLVGSIVGSLVAAFIGAPSRSPVIAGRIGGILGGWVGFLAIWDVILFRDGRLENASPGTIWGISLLGTLVGSLVLSTLAARREKRAWIKRQRWKSVVVIALLLICCSWWLLPVDWGSLEGHGELYCFLQCGWPRRIHRWGEKGHLYTTWSYSHHSIDFVDGICRSKGQHTVTPWQVIKHLF
jgi:hypothetical protein